MNIIVFLYRPSIIGINKENIGNNVTIIAPKYQLENYKNLGLLKQTIFLDNYNEHSIFTAIKNLSAENKIDKIIALSEFDIEFSGFLNQLYNTSKIPKLITSYGLRDKYLMRILMDGHVNNPLFAKVDNRQHVLDFFTQNKLSKAILKPRYGSASQGVHIIRSISDLDKLDINFNNYICESFVSIHKMITADGIFSNGELQRIYFHEYSSPLAQSIEQGLDYNLVTTSTTVYNSSILLQLLKEESYKALHAVSPCNETFPFHMEWFIDDQQQLVFCESAARFGGAEIPQLIKYAHQEDPLQLYWQLVLTDKPIAPQLNLQPKTIAASYMANRKLGTVVSIPDKKLFDFSEQTNVIVKVGQELERISNSNQQLFISIINSNDLLEHNQKIEKLVKLQQQFDIVVPKV